MPQVRCPQCGATNDTRAPDYPFCADCQDNLAKCGYCRWFDDNAVSCTHPIVAGVFEVSRTATPPCVYHSPSEGILVRRPGWHRLGWILLAAAVVALGYGVARLFWSPAEKAPTLELAVEADYRGATVGEQYTVTALIYNASDVTAENLRFEISKKSLREFYLRPARPQPDEESDCGLWYMLSYPPLSPRERRRIALDLVPRKSGTLHVVVRLVSGEHDYHGMADLPVTVRKKAAEPERPQPQQTEEEKP